MKLYIGNGQKDFKVEAWKVSRYGFRALFLTPDVDLALMFARQAAIDNPNYNKGYVHSFEVNAYMAEYCFENRVSHSSTFRNLLFLLKQKAISAAKITKVIDYPSAAFKHSNSYDIVVIFNFELLKNPVLEYVVDKQKITENGK